MADQHVEIDESPPTPPSALSLVNVILVLLITAVGGLGLASLLNQYLEDQDLIQASYPFSQSRILILSYPPIEKQVGARRAASDTGQSSVHWNFPNAGSADIHLRISGNDGTAFSNLTWSRVSGRWQLLSASWTGPKGIKQNIPLGPKGRFLSQSELKLYHGADPLTPMGRGQRALLQGRYKAALTDLNSILDMDPQNVLALVSRGKTYIQIDNLEQAVKDFEAVLLIDPAQGEANRILGQLAAQKVNDKAAPVP